jgi:hypothetical protein
VFDISIDVMLIGVKFWFYLFVLFLGSLYSLGFLFDMSRYW